MSTSDRDRCDSRRTTSGSTTTTTVTVMSTPLSRGVRRLFDGNRPRGHRHGRRSDTIDVLENGLVGRGVLLDVPRIRGTAGWSRVSTCFAKTSRPRNTRGCTSGTRVTSCSSEPVTTAAWPSSSPGTPTKAKAGLHPTRRLFLAERAGRRTRLGRQQRHRSERHRGNRLPDPRPCDQCNGHPPARLPAVRGVGRGIARPPGAGSFCSWPLPLRIVGWNGIAAEPHCDILSPLPSASV